MDICFVIQPFVAEFDKRYDDVLVPAIREVNLEPYRVDQDPQVNIPIESIKSKIKSARVCLVDITIDNPNVWFELGYAIASQRKVILICSNQRSSKDFPFDVRHLNIIRYSTHSTQDFEALRREVINRLSAILKEKDEIRVEAQTNATTHAEELDQSGIDVISIMMKLMNSPKEMVSMYQIYETMKQYGYKQGAVTAALIELLNRGMINSYIDDDYNHHYFTRLGEEWLSRNKDKLDLEKDLPEVDDGIPF